MSTTLPNLITFDNLNFNSISNKLISRKPLVENSKEYSHLPKISLDIIKRLPKTPTKITNKSQKIQSFLQNDSQEKTIQKEISLNEIIGHAKIQQSDQNSKINLQKCEPNLPKIQVLTSVEKRFLLVINGQLVENPKDVDLIKQTCKILNQTTQKIFQKSLSKFQNLTQNPVQNIFQSQKSNQNQKNSTSFTHNSANYLPKNFYTTPNIGVISNFDSKTNELENDKSTKNSSNSNQNLVKFFKSLKTEKSQTSQIITSISDNSNLVANNSETLFWQDISRDLQLCKNIWATSARTNLIPKSQTYFQFLKFLKLAVFCTICIFEQMVSSVFYQTFLATLNLQNLVQFLANFSGTITAKIKNKIQKKLTKWLENISQEFSRDFWWLGTQIGIRKISFRVIKISKSLFFFVKQFYLAIFVICTLFGLFAISQTKNTAQTRSQSLLSKFVEKNTIKFDTITLNAQNSKNSIIDFRSFNSKKEANSQENASVKKIIAHTFGTNDNLEKLGELYNLSIQTIKFNNKIQDGETPKIGQILFIPWTNGYIYNTSEEIAPSELAKFYKVDEKLLVSENKAFWDEKTGKFPKDKLILIPTTNFDQITEFTNAEKIRRENLEKADKQRTQMLNYTAVANEKDSTNSKPNPLGFIWPTVGSISRCVQPGHVACDIANFNSPPIYSVQDGTILASGWKDGGFGYMTLIDHGKGVQTMYMHMSEVYTSPGQKVKQGQSIGKMGCTGNCSGAHLHFEVRVNKVLQNPLLYLP